MLRSARDLYHTPTLRSFPEKRREKFSIHFMKLGLLLYCQSDRDIDQLNRKQNFKKTHSNRLN